MGLDNASTTAVIEEHAELGQLSGFSVFAESACGEPMLDQSLLLDFTPTCLDNDVIQRKCWDFWKLIYNEPKIANIMVLPIPETVTSESTAEIQKVESHHKTAISTLQLVEKIGGPEKAFQIVTEERCKVPASVENYIVDEDVMRKKLMNICPVCSNSVCVCQKKRTNLSRTALKKMCVNMSQWDKVHPKCMDPPGHPSWIDLHRKM